MFSTAIFMLYTFALLAAVASVLGWVYRRTRCRAVLAFLAARLVMTFLIPMTYFVFGNRSGWPPYTAAPERGVDALLPRRL